MKKLVLTLILLLIPIVTYASIQDDYYKLNNIYDYEKFMKLNFYYNVRHMQDDTWWSPEEVLKNHSGICRDFSTLNCQWLNKHGYDAHVYCLWYGIGDGHAITIFKNLEGKLWRFDNNYLLLSDETDTVTLILKNYPKTKIIAIFDHIQYGKGPIDNSDEYIVLWTIEHLDKETVK